MKHPGQRTQSSPAVVAPVLTFFVLLICFFAARDFRTLHKEEHLSFSDGLTAQKKLSEYFPVLRNTPGDTDVLIFHAGTRLESGQIVTSGGRVLTVVTMGKTVAEARERVYDNISRIHFDGCHYRRDVALAGEN